MCVSKTVNCTHAAPTHPWTPFSPSRPHYSLVCLCWSTAVNVAQSNLYCVSAGESTRLVIATRSRSEYKWPRNNNRHPSCNTRCPQFKRRVNGWVFVACWAMCLSCCNGFSYCNLFAIFKKQAPTHPLNDSYDAPLRLAFVDAPLSNWGTLRLF